MYNRVGLMGRFTADPVAKQLPNGASMVTFTLAVDRDYKDSATGERGTDWVSCVAWRGVADFISRYFVKGRAALVDGRLQTRSWTDDVGNRRRVMEVVVENIHFVDSPKKTGVVVDSDTGFVPLPDDTPLPY